MPTVTLRPNGDNNAVWGFYPGSPSSRWDKVDEETPNGDTDYVYSSSPYSQQKFDLTYDSVLDGKTINSVTIYIQARKTSAETTTVRYGLEKDTIVEWQNQVLTETYAEYNHQDTRAWTPAELQNALGCLHSYTDSYEKRVTAIWVVVDYATGAATYIKTWQTDALFKKLGITKTSAIDAAFKKPDIAKTFALDSALVKTMQTQKQVDALFKKLEILKSLGVDTDFLKKNLVRSFALDAHFGAVTARTIQRQIDALLKGVDIQKTFTVDTYIGEVAAQTLTKTLSIDAVFRYKLRLPTPLGITLDGQLVIPLRKEVWIEN